MDRETALKLQPNDVVRDREGRPLTVVRVAPDVDRSTVRVVCRSAKGRTRRLRNRDVKHLEGP